MGLKGKRVLVVGGSSGIGLGVARAAQERGAEVVIAGRSRERLDQAAKAAGPGLRTAVADATSEPAVEALLREIGELDHLVVTAVSPMYQPVRELDLSAARRLIDAKLTAALLLAKHGAPRLRPGGSLTLTSGVAARRPSPRGAVVAAVNGALNALAGALAVELAPLRVNTVSPGWVDTPFWDAHAGARKTETFEAMARRLPTGRVGRAEELAEAYLFLMESGFTTGAVLDVDGGHRFI